jgi:hypothetical protein
MCYQFNNLTYYSVPALPADFRAPTWLRVQLGLIAGRLYFDFDEYKELCSFLGLTEEENLDSHQPGITLDTTISAEAATTPGEEPIDAEAEAEAGKDGPSPTNEAPSLEIVHTKKPICYRFTAKPRAFLHLWISARRKNADWMHSPIGFVAQGKPLKKNHPFFARRDDSEAVQKMALAGSGEQDSEEFEDHDDDEWVLEGIRGEQEDADVEEDEYDDFVEDDEDSTSESEDSDQDKYQVL